jgi:O-antigen/teichoic acid export membrane protein
MRGLAALALPAAVLCAVGAPAVVPLIWGDHWAGAVPLIQVMGVQAICQAYLSPVGQLLKSLNRPRWLLWWAVGTTGLVAVFLWEGVRLGGVVGAAWGVTVAYGVGALVIMRMTAMLIGFGGTELWRTCGKAALAALAMAATGWAVSRIEATPSWLRAAALVLVPGAAYGAALLWLDHSILRALAARLRTLPPSGAAP